MTRKPSLKSQTKILSFRAKTLEDEKIVDDAKQLCLQDDMENYEFLKECIMLGFKAHNWPPGNPQLLLSRFNGNGEPVLDMGKCGFANCNYKAVAKATYLPNNKEYKICSIHVRQAKADSKNWRFNR